MVARKSIIDKEYFLCKWKNIKCIYFTSLQDYNNSHDSCKQKKAISAFTKQATKSNVV